METLRILWLNWRDITNPAVGGAELYTHQIAMRLGREGHEVTLFTSKYPGCTEQERKDRVNIVRRGNASTVYLEAPKFFHAQSRKGNKYDIIIDAVNTIPFLSTLYARRTFIVALLYQLTGAIFLKEFPHPIGHLFYTLESRSYIPWFLKHVNHVMTLSNSTKDELIRVCSNMSSRKVSVIPPGVDHDDFRPGRKSDEPLILFFNRLVRYKQPEHLIIAMKEVCSHIPNAKLLIVGTPRNHRYATHLRNLVKMLGLEKRIDFSLPKPFFSSKILLLQRAWAHVLPSLKEGFGLSILEAAACGTPTIAYNVQGVKDAVRNGKTGLLVRNGDTKKLARSIVALLENDAMRKELGNNAVEYAKNFTWDKAADEFIKIIEKTT